ncbi:O-antigen ligase [Microbacterium sp. SLBN-146]|uniref:O-antigen ligase family protein n=1 Tax=Microbacterium sp. SLBN-146 TaxID=2768457 RepID=UPI001166D818|nr:O-antigen ligase family protein [Microbacterium sp. SLBN-146]TQJ30605.1 O-antigen ligase-like membrane protein [Microbacterium sp. SLBN-146]
MTSTSLPQPMPALRHRGIIDRNGADAVTMLTIYLVLLFAIPSSLTITALGSLGRPSVLWGLIMLAWWALVRLQASSFDVRAIRQPVRFALGAFVVVILVSFAAALLRGQPSDQIGPAVTGVIRVLSWSGVLLVALDGVRTMDALVRIVRRIGIGAGLLAILGVAQFITGQPLIDFFGSLPGVSGADAIVASRGGVARVPGTATHPLEFATVLNAALPLVIAAAVSHGFRWGTHRGGMLWWVPVALIAVSSFIGVSRSAIIGFAVAAVTMIPVLPRKYRLAVILGGGALLAVVVVAVPGLLATTLNLFAGASDDPSTQSRTGALERAPEFIANSPLVGVGFGTFLPRYYIFDNQWVLATIELGFLGVLALAGIVGSAIWSALRARRQSDQPGVELLGYALGASLFNITVLFLFFDGLSFPMSAGMLFLLAGLCGSIRTIGANDKAHATQNRSLAGSVLPEDA